MEEITRRSTASSSLLQLKPDKRQTVNEQIQDERETRILSYVSRAFAERCQAVADFVGFQSLQSTRPTL